MRIYSPHRALRHDIQQAHDAVAAAAAVVPASSLAKPELRYVGAYVFYYPSPPRIKCSDSQNRKKRLPLMGIESILAISMYGTLQGQDQV